MSGWQVSHAFSNAHLNWQVNHLRGLFVLLFGKTENFTRCLLYVELKCVLMCQVDYFLSEIEYIFMCLKATAFFCRTLNSSLTWSNLIWLDSFFLNDFVFYCAKRLLQYPFCFTASLNIAFQGCNTCFFMHA